MRRPRFSDEGTVTVEYAVIMAVGALLAGVLILIVKGDEVAAAIAALVKEALSMAF